VSAPIQLRPKAVSKEGKIGKVSCYVLDDGRCVLSERGAVLEELSPLSFPPSAEERRSEIRRYFWAQVAELLGVSPTQLDLPIRPLKPKK